MGRRKGRRISADSGKAVAISISTAVVSAASRLSCLDSSVPKCLLPMGGDGSTLISHVINQLCCVGIKRVIILLGHQPSQICNHVESFFETSKRVNIEFFEVPESVWAIKGHAAALLHAAEIIGRKPFIFNSSDTVVDPELLRRMVLAQVRDDNSFSKKSPNEKNSPDAVVLIEKNISGGLLPDTFSVIVSDTDSGLARAFLRETPDETSPYAVTTGIFCCTHAIFDALSCASKHSEYYTVFDGLSIMAAMDDVRVIPTGGLPWFAVETKKNMIKAQESLSPKKISVETSRFTSSAFCLKTNKGNIDVTDDIYDNGAIEIHAHGSAVNTMPTASGGEWSEFSVEKWRSAVFKQGSFFNELYLDTKLNAIKAINSLKENNVNEMVTVVEVGCGTGEFIYSVKDDAHYVIGVDINPKFTEWCADHSPDKSLAKYTFLCGDAQHLHALLKSSAPECIWKTRRIVACVGNTLGIIPSAIKNEVYRQMAKVAGPDGLVFIVYWAATAFPDAISNFYKKNPQLCGDFDININVDYKNCNLRTPSGYSTHWTTEQEATLVLKQFDIEKISIETKGTGVIVLGKPYNKLDVSSSPVMSPLPSSPMITAVIMGAGKYSCLYNSTTLKFLAVPAENSGSTSSLIHSLVDQLISVGVCNIFITVSGTINKDIVSLHMSEHKSNIIITKRKILIKVIEVSEEDASSRGEAYSLLQLRDMFDGPSFPCGPFFIVRAGHIYSTELFRRMVSRGEGILESDPGIVLVETDLNRVTAIPSHSLSVQLAPNFRAKSLGKLTVDYPDAIDIGCFVACNSIFDAISHISKLHSNYFTIAEAFEYLSESLSLPVQVVKCAGEPWFAVEDKMTKHILCDESNILPNWLQKSTENFGSGQPNAIISFEGKPIDLHAVGVASKVRGGIDSSHMGGEWSEFSVEKWRNAVFTTNKFFKTLYADTTFFTKDAIRRLNNCSSKQPVLIEVGCGTGEYLWPLLDDVAMAIGIDINFTFIDFCQKNMPKDKKEKILLIKGDACDLLDHVERNLPESLLKHDRIVACVGNTLGIIPERIKHLVYRQMVKVAGADGLVLFVYWNGAVFKEAIRDFYGKNPQLCGVFNPEKDVDWDTSTLRTPEGYVTHWTDIDEARRVLNNIGCDEVAIEVKDKGVLVLGKRRSSMNEMYGGGTGSDSDGVFSRSVSAVSSGEDDNVVNVTR